MHLWRKCFAGPGRLRLNDARSGFTLVEIVIVLIIVAILVGIALPSYVDYRNKALVAQTQADIADMSIRITQYYADHKAFPVTLADIGKAALLDPWKNPYQYLDVSDIKATKGKARKDKNLVPINSDFDLYSMGPDGNSTAPLTAKTSRDDIIRANDGRFIGIAAEY